MDISSERARSLPMEMNLNSAAKSLPLRETFSAAREAALLVQSFWLAWLAGR